MRSMYHQILSLYVNLKLLFLAKFLKLTISVSRGISSNHHSFANFEGPLPRSYYYFKYISSSFFDIFLDETLF